MKIYPTTFLLQCFISLSFSQELSTTTTTKTTSEKNQAGSGKEGEGSGSGSECDVWDDAGLSGESELCESDFVYDQFHCLEMNEKLKNYKGIKEFGEKCNVTKGGEDGCLLLANRTNWPYKDFTDPKSNYIVTGCHRRTNLVCHGFYGRCVCSTKENPGEYYQYDKEEKVCVIRPGFPCEHEFDCSKGTICDNVYISETKWDKVCSCDFRLNFEPGSVNTTNWDNWYCTTEEGDGMPKRVVDFSFNSKTIQRVSSSSKIVSNFSSQAVSLLVIIIIMK